MKQTFPFSLRMGGMAVWLALLLSAPGLQSCKTAALPLDVTSTISKMSTDLPRLMGQASNSYTGAFGDQAQMLMNDMSRAAVAASGNKKHKKVGDMLTDLSVNKFQPFMDKWKVQGKLQPNEITSGIKGVNDALAAIKKQAKMR
jgi:hypothetical protein